LDYSNLKLSKNFNNYFFITIFLFLASAIMVGLDKILSKKLKP